jgi:hypothetical protein
MRALASSPEQCHVHIAETCLGNRPQEASDELLDTQVETGTDRGAEPGVQQAALAQAEDEAVAQAAVLEEWEVQGADSDEPDPDKFTDPWDESYNVMDGYWYYLS